MQFRRSMTYNCGAAAARCTEGERSEPFVQRLSIAAGGGFYNVQPGTAAWFCTIAEDKNF